jgi:hypothetical protein
MRGVLQFLNMASIRKVLIFGSTLGALSAAAWGAHRAMQSPMFTLQVVEVADQAEDAPVDAQTISELAALPLGSINLFDLDLKPVEARVMTHPWIREVRLQKHFPQTLSISVSFRQPQALMQSERGALSYVDVDGKSFGQVNLMFQPDLPILSPSTTGHIAEALQLIHAWEGSELAKAAQISTLYWDSERGFRALVIYPLEPAPSKGAPAVPTVPGVTHGRTLVDLGQDIDVSSSGLQFLRLSRVFRYLSANRVAARQVWADAGKKVVVRTAHGS